LGLIDVCVNQLESGDGEGTGFSHTRLGLGDGVFSFEEWDDTFLLDN
jgi:hypothetical protein